MKALIDQLAEPSRSIAALLAMTGLRIGELLALRWQDVDLVNGFLAVNQSVYEGHFDEPKSRRSKRRVSLGPKSVETLRSIPRKDVDPSALIFAARNGSRTCAECSGGGRKAAWNQGFSYWTQMDPSSELAGK